MPKTSCVGRGGYRGGIRPSSWKGSGVRKADCAQIGIPPALKPDILTIAHWLDEGVITMDEVRSLVDLKRRSANCDRAVIDLNHQS